jgi:hypothetical protein
MGSFDYTCAVSGLPIHCGEKIRYMLLTENPYDDTRPCNMNDVWFPRTFPIRAEYNDYGAVEEVQDGIAKDLWMEGFQTDLVSVGTGENTVHDVPTSKDMSFDEMIDALIEGRLLVTRETGKEERDKLLKRFKKATPKGIPTMQRVRKILEKNSFTVVKHGYVEPGYLINKIRYGQIRIRWASNGPDYGKDAEKLALIQPLFDKKYVTALTAGRGLDAAELLIFVRPGTADFHGHPKDSQKSLHVNHMMIREDVWQQLLKIPTEDWDVNYKVQKYTLQDHKDSLYELYNQYQSELSKEQDPERPWELEMNLRDISDHRSSNIVSYWICKSQIPFTMGLGEHWLMLCQKKLPLEQVKSILDDIAEFVHVWQILMPIRWYWRPSYSVGPQYGEWDKHHDFLRVLAVITREQVAILRERQKENREWDKQHKKEQKAKKAKKKKAKNKQAKKKQAKA